jgi:hypothetical protein
VYDIIIFSIYKFSHNTVVVSLVEIKTKFVFLNIIVSMNLLLYFLPLLFIFLISAIFIFLLFCGYVLSVLPIFKRFFLLSVLNRKISTFFLFVKHHLCIKTYNVVSRILLVISIFNLVKKNKTERYQNFENIDCYFTFP